jgi:hypothetical protein
MAGARVGLKYGAPRVGYSRAAVRRERPAP